MNRVNYPRKTVSHRFGGKLFVLEVIRDLDEAIDLLCDSMSEAEMLDPFAEDLCPYFGVLWPAGLGLAEHLERRRDLLKGKTVLELGAGLGLASLVAQHLGARVLTTDFHPDVEEYFLRNCRHSGVEGNYRRLNWREEGAELGKFDIVMGSDVLYESQHPQDVLEGLLRFVKPTGRIILADPGRNYLETFLKASGELGLHSEEWTYDKDGKVIRVFEFSSETE